MDFTSIQELLNLFGESKVVNFGEEQTFYKIDKLKLEKWLLDRREKAGDIGWDILIGWVGEKAVSW